MRRKSLWGILVFVVVAPQAFAFFEDVCLPRRAADGTLSWCLRPTCPNPQQYRNTACPAQLIDFATVKPGRSMIHHDATYFIAQAVGYRSDVAYWIAAYNEVTDYTQYVPIDQCGVQASATNSGSSYITAQFNGFQRSNVNTDGPLDHYTVSYSPNGEGTDVHGAGGVQALYPLYYPRPGYPVRIDDVYQKTLANLRQWAMLKTSEPGLLCTVGLTTTDADGVTRCVTGTNIVGNVPVLMPGMTDLKKQPTIALKAAAGRKILNLDGSDAVYYDQLESWLNDPARTTGKLWKSNPPVPVPVQLARVGLYIHVLQDTSSHATYCGDDAPSPPGGGDAGTYMFRAPDGTIRVRFGNSCAMGPHLAGHVQETGTGDQPLPLRDYVALNNTVDELIAFGNEVAKHQQGWIVNPGLLPPDVTGGKNARGQTAAGLKAALVGTIVSGTPYSRAEVYRSAVVTRPLQETNSLKRLHAMNAALAAYSAAVNPEVPFESLPGNSPDPKNTKVCWQPR